MQVVCVVDLDETLGHFNSNKQFIVRPHAHLLLDFLKILNIDIILWSNGKDDYVEHVINKHFTIFVDPLLNTRVFGRTVCNISNKQYGFIKHSKTIRKLYIENINLIALDDKIDSNMDLEYDLRIKVQPYKGKNTQDYELFTVMGKIIDYLKNV